jgi:hypothetical protein
MPRTRSRFPRLAAAAVATGAIFAAIPGFAAAAVYTVNTTADNEPSLIACQGAPGDCGLRRAVVKANGLEGPHTIVLPAGRYALTLKGGGENDSLTGDLDVNAESPITIEGAGARTTVIDATGLEDRVFNVISGDSLSLSRLTVTAGSRSGTTAAASWRTPNRPSRSTGSPCRGTCPTAAAAAAAWPCTTNPKSRSPAP